MSLNAMIVDIKLKFDIRLKKHTKKQKTKNKKKQNKPEWHL
jgi:hypothetical protein|tara:strand:+ start:30 stop:152 length:123 start_codon:yes stop_codon:yes gene_type:complete